MAATRTNTTSAAADTRSGALRTIRGSRTFLSLAIECTFGGGCRPRARRGDFVLFSGMTSIDSSTISTPTEIGDPINARILAVSEDRIAGFLVDPFEEIA